MRTVKFLLHLCNEEQLLTLSVRFVAPERGLNQISQHCAYFGLGLSVTSLVFAFLQVKLERVLGLTVSSNAALDCDPSSEVVAFPAG